MTLPLTTLYDLSKNSQVDQVSQPMATFPWLPALKKGRILTGV
jgi:hypothetical protein